MKVSDLRDLTREELVNQQNDLKDELFNLKMRRSIKGLENPLKIRQIRRDIARVATILQEDIKGIKKLAEVKGSVLDTAKNKK